jgi:hypothetical protein
MMVDVDPLCRRGRLRFGRQHARSANPERGNAAFEEIAPGRINRPLRYPAAAARVEHAAAHRLPHMIVQSPKCRHSTLKGYPSSARH